MSSKGRNPRDTPAMRQFARFKASHPDCILLFRMGDFYELFDDDAILVHRVLGITLTERTKGIPMAGVPYHAIDGYLAKLVRSGHRVAVCDQVQDPSEAKGVVERAVTRVVTPGTLVDDSLLDDARANQVAAVAVDDARGIASLAIAEVSTGSFTLLDTPIADLADEVSRLGPSELLYADTDGPTPDVIAHASAAADCPATARPAWSFAVRDAGELLREHFEVAALDGFGLANGDPAIGPAGALLRYLRETQAPDAAPDERVLRHLRPPHRTADQGFLQLDAVTLRSLEVERTIRGGAHEGSLVWVFPACATAMGRRLLRQWLCYPLRERAAIEQRQSAVAALHADRAHADRLRAAFSGVQDVARITGRLATRRAAPRDLVALGGSVAAIDAIVEQLDVHPALAERAARLGGIRDRLAPLGQRIVESCVDDPPAHLREGGLIRDGVDPALDHARRLQHDANGWLAEYQARLASEHDIPSLKVGYNRVFGYYIEITNAHRDKAPAAFTRRQTLKNAERFITEELKRFEDDVMSAQAKALDRETAIVESLTAAAVAEAAALAAFGEVVAELDVLACFAETAHRFGYVRPELADDPVLEIEGGRHPVLDRMLRERFVPNDCSLGGHVAAESDRAGASLALITGPNMAGKSTFIRQVALIALLAHTGSFVPAESARIGLTDRIFTRIGASDELHAGRSTFMVEMTETANILHHATDRSLVVLDEIGRGTSTLDGLSLAWAIAETIAERGCRALFATHYHELTELADRLDAVSNLHVAVREWGDEIVFVYRILPGRTDRSYGIHVARLAGLPPATVARAQTVLETLAVHTGTPAPAPAPPDPGEQMGLFRAYAPHPAVERLRTVDIEVLSPLEAFDELRRLRAEVE